LNSVLRTAVALATADGAAAPELARCHLSCDLLEEAAQWQAPAALPCTAAMPPSALGGSMEQEALAAIQRSLAHYGGNVSAAAKALGISRNTIYRKMAATG
jgi:transcriptional regulator of acetoin/glycerol metabolism